VELRHLRYFVAVAEEKSLTKAAARLYIAQPPLSRQIKELEETIGVPLFLRRPRGMELTSGGEYFLEQARQILDKVDTAVTDTRHISQNRKTLFSIGFVPSVFYGQLPLMVRRLRSNKNLEIMLHELKTREQIDALKSGKIDIGLGRVRIDDPDVEQVMLFDEPLIAALPAGHDLTLNPPTMAELANYPMVAFPATTGPNFADLTLNLFHQKGLKVNVIQQVNDIQTALALVASEMGFTLVPEQVRNLHRDGVKYMPLADNSITTPVIVSRRRGENPNAVMRLTLTILNELVENRFAGRYPLHQ
jgi:DNA-binding transcriptional LysR family regulator